MDMYQSIVLCGGVPIERNWMTVFNTDVREDTRFKVNIFGILRNFY